MLQWCDFYKYKYQAQEIALRNNLSEKKIQTSQLEKKVYRLSEKFLDIDLLDEQSRKLLGLAKPNEIIIQLNWESAFHKQIIRINYSSLMLN